MAASTSLYGLKKGHPNPFRRTVTVGKRKYQLQFEPGKPLDLTAKEIAGLKKEIDGGLIVAYEVETTHAGDERIRPTQPPPSEPETTTEAAMLTETATDDEDTDLDADESSELEDAAALLGDE